MMIYHLIIIFILVGSYSVLSINRELTNLEKNLLYTHIKTSNDLNLFYQKLLQSNDIHDLKFLRNIINENDLREFNIEHKVNISLYYFGSSLVDLFWAGAEIEHDMIATFGRILKSNY
jgi:hypothetical protein